MDPKRAYRKWPYLEDWWQMITEPLIKAVEALRAKIEKIQNS